ncbi:hypothetical protein BLNAU_3158 [Blattamonas nauphoetae]|uniref:Uncharacterized protein n=1 Tax=Blattamonas nauphoetae TaxID=2049346 RepID=A0ABQ9YD82_9EUKA|nr:hypothetical protein BLNAU_3158 [Blattamonas nauphoetae]
MITRYSRFLNWRPNDQLYQGEYAYTLVSIASMVEDGYHFDEGLIAKYGSDFAVGFVNSTTILLSSSHRSIVRDTLSCVRECLRSCSSSNCRKIVSSKLFPRILSTPHLRDLSVVEDQGILRNLLWILQFGTITFRDELLHEVLIPIEPSIVQISRNPHIVSWNDACHTALQFLFKLFNESANFQPSLDFICSSHIPMAFQSLLSKIEQEGTHPEFLYYMFQTIFTWKYKGAESYGRRKILLQALEQEGFSEGLEQALLHNNLTRQGKLVRSRTSRIMRKLGTHCYLPCLVSISQAYPKKT